VGRGRPVESTEHEHDDGERGGVITGRSYEPQLRALLEKMAPMQRGDLVTRATLAEWSGEAVDGHRMNGLIAALRKRLLKDRGIKLACERYRGYRLLPAGEQLRDGCMQMERAARMVRNGAKVAAAAPDAELSPRDRERKLSAVVAMAGMEAMLTKHVDTLDLLEERRAARRARELPGSATGA